MPVYGIYPTRDDAAIAALRRCNPVSIREDIEYGGMIWRDGHGTYGYTIPIRGNANGFNLAVVTLPPGVIEVGNYHTHGGYTATGPGSGRLVPTTRDMATQSGRAFVTLGTDADTWSHQDIATADDRARTRPGYRAYLGTASEVFKYYDPGTGQHGVLTAPAPDP